MSVVPARRRVPSARRPARYAWKLAAGIAVVLLAALGAGCSGSDDGGESTEAVKRVGLMHVGTDHVPPSLDGMRNRLAELGWVEGKNVKLMWRNLEPELADAQARAFVLDKVDVIVAFEDKSIEAAQKATSGDARNRIPIVFLHPSDPVRDGLVKTLRSPGGNLTGVFGARDEVDKQLETYQLLVPHLHRLLTLADPPTSARSGCSPSAEGRGRPAAAGRARRPRGDDGGRPPAYLPLAPAGDVDGAFLLSPSLRLNHSSLSIRLARRAGIPIQAHRKEWVEQGALFSYGIDLKLIGRAGARYVDSILRGTPPSELSVEGIPDIEFAVNLETAARLGIQVPEEMIIRADEAYP